MPAGLVRPSSEIEPIVGVQFGIFSPDEIEKRSVVEITTHTTYEGNEPKIGGLFDPRMGVLENGKTCRSCGQTNHNCPGHFGHYRLARPVYYFQFMETITNVLKCVCIRCSKLLVDKELRKGILKRRGEARWREMLNACSNISRCGQETEDGCGARQPDRYEREGIARIIAEWDKMEGGALPEGAQATKQRQPLEVEYVLRLFRRITDEDVDFMGLNRYWCRPDWMICTVLAVAPPQVRPSVVQDNNQRSEDDLTHKYFDIIKNDNLLKMKIDANAPKNIIDEYTNVVQYHVATLVDNQIPGVAPSAQRSGRPLKSIQQRLGSKEGRIRYNIQGKRVEFSARSVITPDPNLSIGELGVPIKIAMNLTVPERVTQYNKEQLYKLVQNGADVYPGAKSIVRPDGRMISLKHLNRKEIVLHLGDVVNRHLADGDIVLFNRQPTLHRMSMMGHRAKVLPFNTFRLNVMVTAPYNADFDGDEMNAHLAQSYEASTELSEIAAVPMQIISPRNGKPVIGVVQDTLVGSYRITRPIVEFNRREFMNLMMWNKRFEGEVPRALKQADGAARWTGQQVMSQLMPPINLKMKNDSWNQDKVPENEVEIVEGTVTQGIFDKSVFAKPSKGIVHVTYNDYGPKDTVNLLDSLQNTIEQFLVYNGFSVGISDLVADAKTNADIQAAIQKKKKEIEDIILQVHLDLFDNNTGKSNQEEFESRVIGSLNKATEEAGKMGLGSLSKENRLTAMVKAGSKGSTINIAQMMACVGQQAPEGRRIPYGFSDRTLPHYKKYDDGAEARGFVESSFIRGLTPQEFFFHAMSGREGLIDTAVKSVTGDTPILLLEDGIAKRVMIGEWIDRHMDCDQQKIEHHDERDLELLNLEKTTYIPTVNEDGEVSWGLITAITRHDPGDRLYKILTLGGRSVTVSESKSLLIWNQETAKFEHTSSPNVRTGHFVPVCMNVPQPPTMLRTVQLEKYLPKTSYLYGSDFKVAQQLILTAMEGREKIPAGWWQEYNGKDFILPYDSKARFTRTTVRSNLENLEAGFVYPFTTNREHARIPDQLELNKENGIFLGLFLAEGNADVKSGYVQITNNNASILQFVKDWFENLRLKYTESTKLNAIGSVTTSVRGYSTILAQFLDKWVGHGAQHKHIPTEAYLAPEEFIVGVLNGYFSGDGTVSKNSIEVGSASSELIEGINYLCNRLGVFGKIFQTHQAENNLGTENILPSTRLSIRAQWAALFASKVEFLDDAKEAKRNLLKCSDEHRNFQAQNDVVLDEIIDIQIVGTEEYPKLYDLTVPSTLNFGLANGLHVVDTADTGYIQRQLVKAMEDLVVQYDGTVRDARGNIVQFHYGEDGVNSTKIEAASLGLAKQTDAEIRREYGLEGADLADVLDEGVVRGEDTEALSQYVEEVLEDRKMLVEGVYRWKQDGSLFAPVNLERVLLNLKVRFKIQGNQKTDLTPTYLLEGLKRVMAKTQPYHKLWKALLRFYCAPHKLIVKERFTRVAFDTLCELLVTKNWQAWAQPGEQVGIIAAQSIGEPSTQMSCVSSTWIHTHSKNNYTGEIGPFIDNLLKKYADKVVSIGENSVVLDLPEEVSILGVSNDEKTSWKRISQVSRHPVHGGLVTVTTKSGRKTTATLSHSFLKRSAKGIVPVLGSDLNIGDRVPIAKQIPVVQNPTQQVTEGSTTFTFDKEFGWVCGMYLADGSFNGNHVNISKLAPIVEERLAAWARKMNIPFSTTLRKCPYGLSKNNILKSKDLKSFLMDTFGTGSYTKTVGTLVYNAPLEFIQGVVGGFWDGDGNINIERQQIRAGSRSHSLLQHINRLLGYCGIFGVLGSETSKAQPGKIFYTLNVLKKYARIFKEVVGLHMPEKAVALEQVIHYVERDDKHSSSDLYDKIPAISEILAETGKLLKMPGQSRTYGRWLKKESVGRETLKQYIENFREMMSLTALVVDKSSMDTIQSNIALLEAAVSSDVVWDEIVDLEIKEGGQEEMVYDFTVPGNDSFMVDDSILVHNTLNSVDWDTSILIAKNGKILTTQIGEFIDEYYNTCEDSGRIQHLPNNQIYIDLKDGNDWKAISCDEQGKIQWTTLEAITRHPVVNADGTDTILEVTLKSGRKVKATKAKSFLTRQGDKVVDMNGSELKVGDVLPIGQTLAIQEIGTIKEVNLRSILPPTEWMYGTEVQKALKAMEKADETGNRHWFQNGGFCLPYSRSDAFRDAFQAGKNTNAKSIREGYVYPKRTRPDQSQIPENLTLDKAFGFFAGAYLAEGSSNTTQINITNNDMGYLNQVVDTLKAWNVGYHIISEQREAKRTGIKGTTTSLIIHSTLLAKVFQTLFGRTSQEKTIPDWVFQAPDEFVAGLLDGYISGDGTVAKKSGCITVTSVSESLITRISTLLARYSIFSTKRSRMPQQGFFEKVHRYYTLYVPVESSQCFAKNFSLSIAEKQAILDEHFKTKTEKRSSRRDTSNDVMWDPITDIREVKPIHGWVYDLTVEKTRNFTTMDMICMKDTFHLAGVAAKSNMTRGVPRLKELLKVTQNPKATSLTVFLKPEYREKKEKAREVAQDLELTLLRDITVKTAVYYDPKDDETILAEDRDMIKFFNIFADATERAALGVPSEGSGGAAAGPAPEMEKWSKWILRLEMDRERMFNKNISMDDIASVLDTRFSEEIKTVYSDFNSNKMVMRMRLRIREDPLDDLNNLKKFQNKLLNSVVVRGVPGIKAVTFRKEEEYVELVDGEYKPIKQYVLDTDGSNFLEVMNHPAVDGTHLLSTHVHDIYENLGIEATRQVLLNEISELFEEAGVNFRHLGLLCDVMTRAGRLMSVDRYGINKNDIGPLAKASFEETEKILLKAAQFGEMDPITGVSANIMMGQPIRGGTSFSQVLLDESALIRLMEGLPPLPEGEMEEDDEGPTQEEIDQELYADPADLCSSTQLRMNVMMPPAATLLEEPDMVLQEIQVEE